MSKREREEEEIIRNSLIGLWRGASLKSAGWANRLETQGKASVAVKVWSLAQAGNWSEERRLVFVLFRPSPDWQISSTL